MTDVNVVETHLTEYRAKEITERFKLLIDQDNNFAKLSFAGQIERGRLANEAKAAEGRNWTNWRQVNIHMDHNTLGKWMRAAEALDNPEIHKDGTETINDLEKLLAATKNRKARSTKAELTKKVVEQAEAAGMAKAMVVAEEAIKAAKAPKQIVCPSCGTHFVA